MGLSPQEEENIRRMAAAHVQQAANQVAATKAISQLPLGQRVMIQGQQYACAKLTSIERLLVAIDGRLAKLVEQGAAPEPEKPKEPE